ncbi:MAG TPA: acyl carrier protein [Candidatus Saccharimonadales bacterium]|jgi:acyl carrier protein|nr:acyl carrier protein [Candidatus Saccharimonadales bacterium]
MADKLTEKVLDLIAAVKRLPREKISMESTFAELGMDSLDAINLIFEIESEFDISVPDDQAKSITNVQQLVDNLQKLLAEPSAGSATS